MNEQFVSQSQPIDMMQPPQGFASEQFNPGQIYAQKEADQILKIVLENEDLIGLLEHEFRGEVYIVDKDNPDGAWTKKYKAIIENEEGIQTIIRVLRFMGMNKVSLLTSLDEKLIVGKLCEFECKLADILFLKRQEWGIDKEELPMIYHMIRSIVEDAIYRAKEGNLLKTLRSTFSRVESSQEDKTRKSGGFIPQQLNPFK